MLSDYASGNLDESGRGVVELHTTVCEECRRTLALMQKLSSDREWSERESHPHPTSELLQSYYEDPARLSIATREAIEAHLAQCAECTYEIDFLKGLESALPAELTAQTKRTKSKAPFPLWLSRPLPAFSLAAALVGVILVAFLQLGTQTKGRTSDQATQVYSLRALTRGQGLDVSIPRTGRSQIVRVALPIAGGRDNMDYRIRTRDERETTEFANVVGSDRSHPDRIVVDLDTEQLPDGRYFVVLTEISRDVAADSTVRRFPFELITTP